MSVRLVSAKPGELVAQPGSAAAMRRRSAVSHEPGHVVRGRMLVHFGVVRDDVVKVHELTLEL